MNERDVWADPQPGDVVRVGRCSLSVTSCGPGFVGVYMERDAGPFTRIWRDWEYTREEWASLSERGVVWHGA